MIKTALHNLFEEQLKNWPLAGKNFNSLSLVESKRLEVDGVEYIVQFNPARITSSAAKVDTKSIQERKCFLCSANRPTEQTGIEREPYTILINPFPIFPLHLTIPDNNHVDQLIAGRVVDMLELAKELDEYVIFYNGPKCGASAPDHMHFQAGNKGFLPLEMHIEDTPKDALITVDNASTIFLLKDEPRNTVLIKGRDKASVSQLFDNLYNELPIQDGEKEPMLNLLAWYSNDCYYLIVLLRKKHRPACYFETGEKRILSSPASVDLGGVFITPIEEDFKKINTDNIKQILSEICLNREEVIQIIQQLKRKL